MSSLCNFSVPMNHLLSNLFLKYTSTFVHITAVASTIWIIFLIDHQIKEKVGSTHEISICSFNITCGGLR